MYRQPQIQLCRDLYEEAVTRCKHAAAEVERLEAAEDADVWANALAFLENARVGVFEDDEVKA